MQYQYVKSDEGFEPRGAIYDSLACRDREYVVSGGVNTGKTYGNLQRGHLFACMYPNARILLLRKTLTDLISTGVVTYEKQVLVSHGLDINDPNCPIKFYSKRDELYYEYPNGARIYLSGYQKSSKVLSAEYDLIIVVQCEELTEQEWAYLLLRVGRGAGKNAPYAIVLGCANPHRLGDKHWVWRRADPKFGGSLKLFMSTRHDNPHLWNREEQVWTEEGQRIEDLIQTLPEDVRLRLGEGVWKGGETLVYPEFKDDLHLITWEELVENKITFEKWFMGVDWGWSDPGSLSLYGLGYDSVLYQMRTTYRTQELIGFWERRAVAYQRWVQRYFGNRIERVYCDPSMPAYIEQFQAAGLPAVKGHDGPNSLMPGINACKTRLSHGTFKIVRNNVDGNKVKMEPGTDPFLESRYLPTCLYDEITQFYQNPEKVDDSKLDLVPLPGFDHSSDEWRYVCQKNHIPPKMAYASTYTVTEDAFLEKMGFKPLF